MEGIRSKCPGRRRRGRLVCLEVLPSYFLLPKLLELVVFTTDIVLDTNV